AYRRDSKPPHFFLRNPEVTLSKLNAQASDAAGLRHACRESLVPGITKNTHLPHKCINVPDAEKKGNRPHPPARSYEQSRQGLFGTSHSNHKKVVMLSLQMLQHLTRRHTILSFSNAFRQH